MNDFVSVGVKVRWYHFTKWMVILTILLFFPSAMILFAADSGSGTGVIFTILLIELVFVAVVSQAFAYLSYVHFKYKNDEHSLSFKKGLFSVRTTVIPYSKITNIAFDQSLLERLFCIGTLAINQEDAFLKWGPLETQPAEKLVAEVAQKSHVQKIEK